VSWRSSGGRGRPLERELERLENEARKAPPGFDAPFYNRAGDLCLKSDLTERAFRFFGAAIDAYITAGRYNAAAAVCRKLLRVKPRAVRPRCTLAWLAIGYEHLGEAREQVEQYVEAARRAGNARYAVRHLRLMADLVADTELLAFLAGKLDELGDTAAGDEVRALVTTARDARLREVESEERWIRVVRAALMGPSRLDE
jgi:tetratricopeptide (TPR) repeat protein